jgi:alpha-amylase
VPPVVAAFEIHQPHRLRRDGVNHDAGSLHDRYFDAALDERIFEDVAENCYEPATERLVRATRETDTFAVNLSISTSWLEQARRFRPDLIDLVGDLPDDAVEFVGQAHYHSLAGLFADADEFAWQLRRHREAIDEEFGATPRVATNTELIYHDAIGRTIAELYDGVFTEGAPRVLGWRSPNYVYAHPDADLDIFLRNRDLTDHVGYRFSDTDWFEHPLTATKYASWLAAADGDLTTLFMDYETFGEHHWRGTGILDFLETLPGAARDAGVRFLPASEALEIEAGELSIHPHAPVSWADREMDASAWIGTPVQRAIFNALESMAGDLPDEETRDVWRRFLTSDHLHHVAAKAGEDHSVHDYFSPYDSRDEGLAVLFEHLLDFQRVVERRR